MKKIYAINGSPRKDGNTARLLKQALAGAERAGAETCLIQLGELDFSGCRSCFACKRLDHPAEQCVIKDDLTPFLSGLRHADGIILGSPVYFGAETGLYRNFIERLYFPLLRYTSPPGTRAEKQIDFAFIYTMNVPRDGMEEYGYKERLESGSNIPKMIFRSQDIEILYACDTFQFDDYDKYESSLFDKDHKAEMRKTVFQDDLKKAFAIGKKLAE